MGGLYGKGDKLPTGFDFIEMERGIQRAIKATSFIDQPDFGSLINKDLSAIAQIQRMMEEQQVYSKGIAGVIDLQKGMMEAVKAKNFIQPEIMDFLKEHKKIKNLLSMDFSHDYLENIIEPSWTEYSKVYKQFSASSIGVLDLMEQRSSILNSINSHTLDLISLSSRLQAVVNNAMQQEVEEIEYYEDADIDENIIIQINEDNEDVLPKMLAVFDSEIVDLWHECVNHLKNESETGKKRGYSLSMYLLLERIINQLAPLKDLKTWEGLTDYEKQPGVEISANTKIKYILSNTQQKTILPFLEHDIQLTVSLLNNLSGNTALRPSHLKDNDDISLLKANCETAMRLLLNAIATTHN